MGKIDAQLIESFLLINRFFQEKRLRYCLIGGLAAGYWGEPRFTRDIDFTVATRTGKLNSLTQQLKKEGYKVVSKGEGQIQIVQKGSLHFQADVILAETDYQDWVVQRAISIPMFSIEVPMCSAEDLIILKLIANRRQDLLDIENVLKKKSVKLDKAYLKKWFEIWELDERFQEEFGTL